MHYADIIAALIKAGHPPSKLAREISRHQNTVSQVIHGKSTSRYVATEISRVTGFTLEELWPGKYTANRKPGRVFAA